MNDLDFPVIYLVVFKFIDITFIDTPLGLARNSQYVLVNTIFLQFFEVF